MPEREPIQGLTRPPREVHAVVMRANGDGFESTLLVRAFVLVITGATASSDLDWGDGDLAVPFTATLVSHASSLAFASWSVSEWTSVEFGHIYRPSASLAPESRRWAWFGFPAVTGCVVEHVSSTDGDVPTATARLRGWGVPGPEGGLPYTFELGDVWTSPVVLADA